MTTRRHVLTAFAALCGHEGRASDRARRIVRFDPKSAPGAARRVVPADHGWSVHHWRIGGSPPREVVVKDHTKATTAWPFLIRQSVAEWNAALAAAGVPLVLVYRRGAERSCPNTPFTEGMIRVCQKPDAWPWLGATTIAVGQSGHIRSAKIAVRSYDGGGFEDVNTACHELAHTLGLDHGDGMAMATCCYGSREWYERPGPHDVEQLAIQYHGGGEHGG